jgi:hypothetical protein
VSLPEIVQEQTGASTATGTSVVVSLPSGTAAGNAVVVVVACDHTVAPTLATDFILDRAAKNSSMPEGFSVYSRPNVGASETSWTFTLSIASHFVWHCAEVANLGSVDVTVAAANTGTLTDGATRSTGTTAANGYLDNLCVAVHALARVTGSGTLGSWSGQTADFAEVAEVAQDVAGPDESYGLAVSHRFNSGTFGPYESTATWAAGTATTVRGWAAMVVYGAADSQSTTPLVFHTGFEQGTHHGIASTLGIGVPKLSDGAIGTHGTSYLIQSGSARNGGYGLRIVQSAAAACVLWSATSAATAMPGSQGTLVAGFSVRPVSGSGVVALAEVAPIAGTICQVVYNHSTNKIGVRWGSGGTVAYQAGTTALDAWAWVDLRVSGFKTATWHVDWQLEESGVETLQSSPADLTSQTVSVLAQIRLGGNLAQTMTADFDDLCLSNFSGAWPLTIHKVLGLTVDTGGTPTLSGTSTNFSRFTANGTLAAIDAATAALLVDERPPVFSASSDGVCQTATAASDYIEFPMATYALGDAEIISAVCMEAAMWGGTGAGTGTVGLRGWDGTTETVLLPTSIVWDPDSATTGSSTVPPWVRYQWSRVGGWTKAALDAAAVRFGFSTDATPDMGMHVVYLAVAVRQAQAATVIGEAGSVALEANVNPYTTGVRSLVTTTPSDQGTTLNWTDAGGPHTQIVAAASTDTQTLDAGAGEVTFVELVSGNELPDRE